MVRVCRRTWGRLGLVLGLAAILVSGCGRDDVAEPAGGALRPAEAPAPTPPPVAPPIWEATSTRGAYRVRVRPEEAPIPLSRIHRWLVEIEDAQGNPVSVDGMSVGGGMPQHGHGFVTAPEAMPTGEGQAVIDGMNFHMGGAWRLDLGIMGPKGFDAVSFEIQVGP